MPIASPSFSSPAAAPIAAPERLPWWGRIGLLWLMFVPVCVAFYTLSLPIGPNDFWYHARAGQVIATSGLPSTQQFSAGMPADAPYFYQSWLAEWMIFKVLQRGGLAWIVVLRSACMTLAFALLVMASYRRALWAARETGDTLELETFAARVAALATLVAFVMAAPNMDTRPQMFSIPLFAGLVFILSEWPRANASTRRTMGVVLLLITVLWANTHGAFILSVMVLGTFAGGEALIKRFGALRFWGHVLSWREIGGLAALALACALAVLLNPHGAGIYGYLLRMQRNTSSHRFIAEWQAPHLSFDEPYNAVFFAALPLLGLLLWKAHKRSANWGGVRAGEIAVLLVLGVMALDATRSVIWFGLFLAPVLSGALSAAFVPRQAPKAAPVASRGVAVVNAVMALLLMLSCVPMLPWFKPMLPLPPSYTAGFAPNPPGAFPLGFSADPPLLLDRSTPVEAALLLRRHPPRGRVWNDMVFGSYLTWASQDRADLKPSSEPRVELYPLSFWQDYGRLCDGPPDAAHILKQRGFSDALLDTKLQKRLIARLRQAGWRLMDKRKGIVLLRAP